MNKPTALRFIRLLLLPVLLSVLMPHLTRASHESAAKRAPIFTSGDIPPASSQRSQMTSTIGSWSALFGAHGMDHPVAALVTDRSGSVYAGGDFTYIGDLHANHIARWNGTAWSTLGSGMNGRVTTLAAYGNLVYAGGFFTAAGGVRASYVARWDGTAWSPLDTGLSGPVLALALDQAGVLYAGGVFVTAGGVPAMHIARWEPATGSWSALGSGISTFGQIFALAVDGTDVYAGGDFVVAGGVKANYIAHWDGATWSPLTTGTAGGSFRVHALALDGHSSLYVGGEFTSAGGVATESGVARWDTLAKSWSALGQSWMRISSLVVDSAGVLYAGGYQSGGVRRWDGSTWAWVGTGTNAPVAAVAVDSLGRVYAGGEFSVAGGLAANGIARWDGSRWSSLVTSQTQGLNGMVSALTSDSQGSLYAGGWFSTAGEAPAARIARWNGASWSALGKGMNGPVLAIAVNSAGTVYAGGSFTTAGGTPAASIARWSGTAWSPLGAGLDGTVSALVVDGAGTVYAGGDFSMAGGSTNIARWDGTMWSALGSGTDGPVAALAVDQNNRVYAGGSFTTAGGVHAAHIARWDGTTWSALDSGTDDLVTAVSLDSRGTLYVGGRFTHAGGVAAGSVARWDDAQHTWSALGTGVKGQGVFSPITALLVDADDRLVAAGSFEHAGSVAATNIARWDGSTWMALGTGTDERVQALARVDAAVYAGGLFTTAGDRVSLSIACWTETSSATTKPHFPMIAASPSSKSIQHAGASQPTVAVPRQRPNIIMLLLDDLDLSSIAYMPNLKTLLIDQGLTFSNAFVADSVCCPSRSTILRGQYTHNHQVLTNDAPDGSYYKFHALGHENSTVASWLQSAGYRTVLLGKYLNGYTYGYLTVGADYVPPGWSRWYGIASQTNYYDYVLNQNHTRVSYGSQPQDYQTDVLARHATDFIQTNGPMPFFMYLTPLAPHYPATPAPRHADAYPGARAPRPPSFNEADVSDKPEWVRSSPLLSEAAIAQMDATYRKQLQSMLAVDDMIGSLVETLRATGKLDTTYFFFTSDNGTHFGQHRIPGLSGKSTAYEEDIHVPLIVRGPGVPAGQVRDQLTLNTDFAPTFADLAGMPFPGFVDGRSLKPLLTETPYDGTWRSNVLIEHWPARVTPQYQALRTERYLYVEYVTGERELYDMAADPFQLRSLHASADPSLLKALSARLAAVARCQGAGCRIAEDVSLPELAVRDFTAPEGQDGSTAGTFLAFLSLPYGDLLRSGHER